MSPPKPFFVLTLISQWSQFWHESLIRISRRMDVGFQWTKKGCFHRYGCHQVDVIFRGFHPPGHRGCLVDALSAVPTSGDQKSRSKWWECKPPHRHKQHVAFFCGHVGGCNEIYTQSPKNPGSEGSQPAGTKRASLAGLRVVCWDSLKMEGFFLLHKKSIQAARADFWGHQISQVCTLNVLVGDIVDLPPVFREVKTDWKTMVLSTSIHPKTHGILKLFEAWQSEAKKQAMENENNNSRLPFCPQLDIPWVKPFTKARTHWLVLSVYDPQDSWNGGGSLRIWWIDHQVPRVRTYTSFFKLTGLPFQWC